jgi:RNA polymerase sigma factor (sigma-70 family)
MSGIGLSKMAISPRADSDNSEFRTNISLIAKVRDRTDAESWREFYKFYHPLLTRYLRRLGLPEDSANDVIQDVFVRLLQALPTFDLDSKRGRFRSYLWKLTYSGLVDEARRVKARKLAEEEWVKRFLIADEAESRKLHQARSRCNVPESLGLLRTADAPQPAGVRYRRRAANLGQGGFRLCIACPESRPPTVHRDRGRTRG